jgi:ADP-heptose:LPS heptosyltransferase
LADVLFGPVAIVFALDPEPIAQNVRTRNTKVARAGGGVRRLRSISLACKGLAPVVRRLPLKRFGSETHALQWIDRRIGAPVCFVLTLVRKLGDLFGPGKPEGPVSSLLIIKLAEQGSTVLAHGALRNAVDRVGRENVHLMVFEENRFIVDVLDLVPGRNVHAVRTGTLWEMAASGWRILAEMRRRRLDACIDFEFFARFSTVLAFLSGARRRIGFHAFFGEGPYRGDLLTHRVLYNPHLHTSRTFASLVWALDVDPERLPTIDSEPPDCAPPPPFVPSPEEAAEAVRMLDGFGVPAGARLVLLNPNAGDLLPLRKWPSGNYADLARRLLGQDARLWVAFTGSGEESPRVAEIAASVGSPRCVCLAGRTTLRQLLVVFGLAEVLVTNDSGPAHFASLTTVDVVSLFGPETPLLFAATGPRSHPLWAGIACSPCVNAYNNRQSTCRDNVCLKRITVDQVLATVTDILADRVSSRA